MPFSTCSTAATMFVRVIRSEIGGLRGEIVAEIAGINRRIDSLDRDVQALVKHTFGIDRG